MNRALLEAGLSRLAADPTLAGYSGSPKNRQAWTSLADDLIRYLGELELWNPKLGLVEATGDELISKHLLDCLAALPVLLPVLDRLAAASPPAATMRLADIGSGAGLPGVVLCLALRRLWTGQFTMHLVEKQQRRVGFLLNVKALLALGNLELHQESLEAVGQREPASFGLVTARAFKPLEPGILAELRRLLQPNGSLFLYKGKRQRIDEEIRATLLAPASVRVVPLAVPFLDEERHIVMVAAD